MRLTIGPNWISAALTLFSAGVAMRWPDIGTLLILASIVVLLAGVRIDGLRFQIHWVDRKRAKQVIIGVAAMIAVIAAIICGRPYLVAPGFSADIRSAVIYTARSPLSLFMVEYPSSHGDTISPVCYLFNIRIINTQNIPEIVSNYSVMESKNENGPWVSLLPISLITNKLFSPNADAKGRGGGSMSMPRGTYRIGTPMQPDTLRTAVRIIAFPNLDIQLQTPIPSYGMAQGWAAFDCSQDTGSTNLSRNFYQMIITGRTGRKASITTATPLPNENESEPDVKALEVTGQISDLSRAYVKFFHESQ